MRRYVAVVGPGDGARTADEAMAFEVGRLLAAQSAIVLTGGLGGVMAAAARGAADAGGVAVGLLPGADSADGDAAHTLLLPTGLGELRNGLLVRCAHGLIAVGGSWGTLSEIALAMRMGVPVVSIGGWTLTDREGRAIEVRTAASATEAVAAVLP